MHFDSHLFLHTRALREMTIQDLSILLNFVFVALLYFARLASKLFLIHLTYFLTSLTSRSFALVFASIYFSLISYNVSLVCVTH